MWSVDSALTEIMRVEYQDFDVMTKFFMLGWVSENTETGSPVHRYPLLDRNDTCTVPIPGSGYFWYSKPWYVDFAENDSLACIKIGQIHDDYRLLSAEDILNNGWVTPSGISYEKIGGNGVVIYLSKTHPQCSVFRNLLSVPVIYYRENTTGLLITDNLRLMIDLLPNLQLNEEVLPQHFIYRAVYGGHTYVRGVQELLPGENLSWQDGKINIDLKRKIRDLYDSGTQMSVNAETAGFVYSELKRILAIYLAGKEKKSATMLSGGVDSSLLQVVINELGNEKFPSFSFELGSYDFDFEVHYARDSIEKLGTRHIFYPISPTRYRDALIKSIEILGQPVPDDVRPCFLALADFISTQHQQYNTWIHGHIADGLAGVSNSLVVAQGDKYRAWPIGLLWLLGVLLKPLSQSKSYGATKAAETLSLAQDINSPRHHLNSVGMYTNWETVHKCFGGNEILAAFSEKRKLVDSQVKTNLMVENMNTLDLLTDGIEPASITRQLGLYCGGEYLLPYGDESLIRVVYAFEPMSRYTYSHQVKPILKMALGSRLPVKSLNNPKGWSGVGNDLWSWMREGEMQDMVRAIDRPGFMDRNDFESKLQNPDWFTWSLLTLDLFKKSI